MAPRCSTASNKNWFTASISANGQYQTAVVSAGNIWTNKLATIISGPVAIGKTTITSNVALDVSGNVLATNVSIPSDYRIKDNIRPITRTLDNLCPISYFNKLSSKEEMGFIAHELQEHFPFLVNGEKDAENYQSVNYMGLIGLLVKEIQDLKKEVKEIKSNMSLMSLHQP
jgi:hypothetical protein